MRLCGTRAEEAAQMIMEHLSQEQAYEDDDLSDDGVDPHFGFDDLPFAKSELGLLY